MTSGDHQPLHGYGDVLNDEVTDPDPTSVPPGSAAKLAVLQERARRGQHLFHEEDCQSHEDTDASLIILRRGSRHPADRMGSGSVEYAKHITTPFPTRLKEIGDL